MPETPYATGQIDPTLQAHSLTTSYETEKGTAFRAMHPDTGEVISPQEGISIEIYDQWAAEGVATEISGFENIITGDDTESVSDIKDAFNSLSYLAMLHMNKSHVDAMKAKTGSQEFADVVAQKQLDILCGMPKSSDQLAHVMNSNPDMAVASGSLKPKTGHETYHSRTGLVNGSQDQMAANVKSHVSKLVQRRTARRAVHGEQAPALDTDEGTNGLHSLLVHFSEQSFPSLFSGVYYPRAKIMEKSPVGILGQDNKLGNGAAGIKNFGDEAHHKKDREAVRDRFARVSVELSPRVRAALTERAPSQDIAFMADTVSAEKAVDYEYPLEDSVLFLSNRAAHKVIADAVRSSSDPTLISPRLREQIAEVTPDDYSALEKVIHAKYERQAMSVIEKMENGEKIEFASPDAEVFWKNISESIASIEQKSGLNSDYSDHFLRSRVYLTAFLRSALKARGYSQEWADNNVFISDEHVQTDKSGYDAYAERTKQAWMQKHAGFSYIQARAEKLQFDQVDLMMQLPAYKK